MENEKCQKCELKKYATGIMDYYLSLKDTLDLSESALKNFYKVFIRLLWFSGKQPKHVSKEEAAFIREMAEERFSIGDIADIVSRSKSTVSDVLQR